MSTPDGSIIINVDITDEKAKKQLEALESKYRKQTESIERQSIAVDKLRRKHQSLAAGGSRGTANQKQLQAEQKNIEALTASFEKLMDAEERARQEYEAVRSQFLSGSVGWTERDKAFENYKAVEAEVEAVGKRLRQAEKSAMDLSRALAETQADPKLTAEIQEVQRKLELSESVLARFKQEAAETNAHIQSTYGQLSTSTQSLNNSLDGTIKRLGKTKNAMNDFGVQSATVTQSVTGMFDRMVTRIGKMISTKLYYLAVFKLISSVLNGFKELAVTNERVNGSISQIYSSVMYLKNSLLNALIPVLEALTPIIVKIVDGLALLVNGVGRLISLLTGKPFTAATKENLDYAASLDKSADSAKKLERALAPFDELNKLSFGADAGSGSGGSPGAGTGGTIGADQMDIPILARFNDYSNNIRNFGDVMVESTVKTEAFFKELNQASVPEWMKSPILVPSPVFSPILLPEWMEAPLPVPQWAANPIVAPRFQAMELPKWATESLPSPEFAPNPITAPKLHTAELMTSLEGMKNSVQGAAVAIQMQTAGAASAVNFNVEVASKSVRDNVGVTSEYVAKATAESAETAAGAYEMGLTNMMENTVIWGSNLTENHKRVLEYLPMAMRESVHASGQALIDYYKGTDTAAITWGNAMQEKTGKTAQGMHNSFVEGLSASWESFKDFMSGIGEQISGFFKKHPWVAPAAITLAAVGGLALAPFTGGASLAATAGALSIAALRSAPTMPSMSSVPYLAKGAVIPPNNEFLAVLGDQRSGYNIETPLAVMVEAFKTAIADMGIAGEKDITLHVVADRGFVRGLKFELDALDKYKGVNLVVTS